MDQQRFGRAIEDALYKIVNHAAYYLALRLGRRVHISTIPQGFGQAPLLLERSHHRHHRRIRNFAALEQLLIDVAHGR